MHRTILTAPGQRFDALNVIRRLRSILPEQSQRAYRLLTLPQGKFSNCCIAHHRCVARREFEPVAVRIKLPGGTLKIKTYRELRSRERDRRVPVVKIGAL